MLISDWLKRMLGGSEVEQAQQPAQQPRPVQGEGEQFLYPNPGTVILIVDDSKTIHVVLAKQLQRKGYQTLAAYDGNSGVEMARQYKPSLVLMDVVMPGISGFHATRDIRASEDPQVAEVPIIIMSGNAQATEEFWSRKIGANDFLAKPFTDNELLGRIEKALYPGVMPEHMSQSRDMSAA